VNASQIAVLGRGYIAPLFMLAAIVGCSNSHSLSHEELERKYWASVSLSSETEDFLKHLGAHGYSHQFVAGHLTYLQKQGIGIQNDLDNASAEARDVTSLTALRMTIDELTQILNDLPSQASSEPGAGMAVDHLRLLQQHLEQDKPR